MHDPDLLIPANPSPRFSVFFKAYVTRLLRKNFHTVSLAKSGEPDTFNQTEDAAPVLALFTHTSWWDPLVYFWLINDRFPDHRLLGPMDLNELKRFAFLKKIGTFGIDPDNPASLNAMRDYLLNEARTHPRSIFCITPQGDFADPRAPLIIRPGAAALAAAFSDQSVPRVLSVALEYVFWLEKKPELLIRVQPIHPPEDPSRTTAWHRTITTTMRENADALAQDVQSRDANRFTVTLGNTSSRINPAYDLWQRLTGKKATLRDARETSR